MEKQTETPKQKQAETPKQKQTETPKKPRSKQKKANNAKHPQMNNQKPVKQASDSVVAEKKPSYHIREIVEFFETAPKPKYDVPFFKMSTEQKKESYVFSNSKAIARNLNIDSDYRPFLVNAKRSVIHALLERISFTTVLMDSMGTKFDIEKNKNNFDAAQEIMELEKIVYDAVSKATENLDTVVESAIKAGMGAAWQKKLYQKDEQAKKEDNNTGDVDDKSTEKTTTAKTTTAATKAAAVKK